MVIYGMKISCLISPRLLAATDFVDSVRILEVCWLR